MQTENFESKIKRIAETFDRPPPPQTWEDIRQHISGHGSPGANRKKLQWSIPLVLVATLFITGLIFWSRFTPEIRWMDDYWDALALAKQKNKPLLLLFTRTCPDCEKFEDILARSGIEKLGDHYIPVRLLLDDQTPMDAAPAVPQLFPETTLDLVHLPQFGQSAWRVAERGITLKTWGKVWEFWLDEVFHSQRPPVLVLLSPAEEQIAQFNYVLNTELSAAEMSWEIRQWLALQLEIMEGAFLEEAKLFANNCAACHNRNMKDHLTGPALGGIREKWSDYPETDLYDFIRNSQRMIADGHPLALASWNEWKPTIMTEFPNLTDQELKKLVDYIEWQYERN